MASAVALFQLEKQLLRNRKNMFKNNITKKIDKFDKVL